ncbi:SET and MYND domain-containing protein 4-like [Sitodiplosis mosellana]|uniref:SET and MYND domain-containing protein 4-like n=1 Tax=Sitodiplosis mosellana TaxID=263140 RepID=UPI002444516F|nr:SET and MYND domain-containing protein 4-like [Sitodiplosis mosellana]
MLWKKDTSKNDAMYVDIFAKHGGKAYFGKIVSVVRQGNPSSTLKKNDAVSLQKRNKGNDYFKRGEWSLAMELYGESLCYATIGSKNISLAYANRSTCFLKLKLYNECLIDIELAKEAGYPAELMPKLDRRKDECLKAIKQGAQPVNFKSKLSVEPHEHFPCMANVLKIGRDAKGKVALFAKEDIDVGQTIVSEKTLITYLYWRPGWKCNICLKECTNLLSCNKCTVAMFCGECQSNSLHEYECGLRFSNNDLMNGTTMRIVRSCLLAIDMFASVDELMTFVEQVISSGRNQIPSTFLGEKSQYEAFLKLPMNPANQCPVKFLSVLSIAFSAQKMLMRIPKINSMFQRQKYRRFLMHLIVHHYQVMEINSVVSCIRDDGECIAFVSQTGLMIGYMKHSNAPNVTVSKTPGNTVDLITTRPVKKGQQIAVRSHLATDASRT